MISKKLIKYQIQNILRALSLIAGAVADHQKIVLYEHKFRES